MKPASITWRLLLQALFFCLLFIYRNAAYTVKSVMFIGIRHVLMGDLDLRGYESCSLLAKPQL